MIMRIVVQFWTDDVLFDALTAIGAGSVCGVTFGVLAWLVVR